MNTCTPCPPTTADACACVLPVFQEYEDRLRSFIGKRVKDRSQSEDISHQVLLKLYAHCEQIPKVRHLKGWLYQITRHAVYDYFRESGRLTSLENEENLTEQTEGLFAKELLELVQPMISLLPPEYALPLTMSDLEGIPQKEVAVRLGLGLSATKSRIQRGREKLRGLFLECCHLELDRQGSLIGAEIRQDCLPLQQRLAGVAEVPPAENGCC